MKKLAYISVSAIVAYFVYREYIHGLEYMYNLCLCRGDKAFLMNCNDMSNERRILKKLENEIADTELWYNRVRPSNVYLAGTSGRAVFMRLFRQKKPTRNWAIVVHGYGCTGQSMMINARAFYEQGFNVIVPDLPCHGHSYGRVIGMGQYECKDIIRIADRIVKTDKDAEILLYGVSMGAATVLMSTGKKSLPRNIRCAISDCSYTCALDIFKSQIKTIFHLPPFPFIMDLDKIYGKKTGGSMHLKKAGVLKSVAKSKTPTLFIHGGSDKLVPTYMVYSIFNNARCEKDIMVIKDAGHGVSAFKNKEKYWQKVFSFADKYLQGYTYQYNS